MAGSGTSDRAHVGRIGSIGDVGSLRSRAESLGFPPAYPVVSVASGRSAEHAAVGSATTG